MTFNATHLFVTTCFLFVGFSLTSLNQLSLFFRFLSYSCHFFFSVTMKWKLSTVAATLLLHSFIHIFAIAVEIYLSPVETHCSNVDYFPDMDDEKLQPNDDAITRLHLARSCVALFILRWVNYTYMCICAKYNGQCICHHRWWWDLVFLRLLVMYLFAGMHSCLRVIFRFFFSLLRAFMLKWLCW